MNWKKLLSFILVLIISITVPITNTFAEEKDKKKEENPDEIIKHEDEDEKGISNKDIPDPPRDDSLIGDEEDVHEVEIETPSSVTGEKTEGTGTVVDFSTTGSRAFYTIVDQNNNTFYLMIDMDKADNNVYFLSDVNQEQLSSTAGTKNEKETGFFGNNEHENNDHENKDEQKAEEVDSQVKSDKKESSSNLGFLLTVVLIGLVGAVGYYFFVIKKKQSENTTDESMEDEEMQETYEDEGLFKDENSTNEETESDHK